jgi:hypothetical protein
MVYNNWSIIQFQNKNNLIVCSFVAFFTNLYFFSNNNNYLHITNLIVSIHVFSDLFLTKNSDMILHHIFSLLCLSFKYVNNVSFEDDSLIILTTLNTEMSSFFYVYKLLLEEKKQFILTKISKNMFDKISILNDLLFFSSFLKLRIINYYYNLIHNEHIYISMHKYTKTIIHSLHFYIGSHGLYLLNIYWFMIILKKMYKYMIIPTFSQLQSYKFINNINSYTYLLNIFISTYTYSKLTVFNPIYLLDITGITILSYYSYKFHHSKYLFLKNNPDKVIEYTDNNILPHFLKDALLIHIRSFLCVITHFYYIPNNFFYIYFSGLFHIVGYISLFSHIKYLKNNEIKFLCDDSKESNNRLFYTNLYVSIPVLYDAIIILVGHSNTLLKVDSLLITILIGMSLTMKPFYNASHLLFHLFLFFQTYFLCQSNVAVIRNC